MYEADDAVCEAEEAAYEVVEMAEETDMQEGVENVG